MEDTMTVIELLNDIANGKEVPDYITWEGLIYEKDLETDYVCRAYGREPKYFLNEVLLNQLNDKVKIPSIKLKKTEENIKHTSIEMKEQNKKGYEILKHCPSDCAQAVPVRVIDLINGYAVFDASDIMPTKFTIRDIDFTYDDDLYRNIYFALYNDQIEKYDIVYIPKEGYKEIPEITETYENYPNKELYAVIKERLNDVIREVNSMNNKG